MVACPHIAHTGIWFHGVDYFCSNVCNEEWGFSSSLMQELTLNSEHCYFLFVLSGMTFHSRANFWQLQYEICWGSFYFGDLFAWKVTMSCARTSRWNEIQSFCTTEHFSSILDSRTTSGLIDLSLTFYYCSLLQYLVSFLLHLFFD